MGLGGEGGAMTGFESQDCSVQGLSRLNNSGLSVFRCLTISVQRNSGLHIQIEQLDLSVLVSMFPLTCDCIYRSVNSLTLTGTGPTGRS